MMMNIPKTIKIMKKMAITWIKKKTEKKDNE